MFGWERMDAVFVACKPVDSIISRARLLIICFELSLTLVAMTTRFEVGVCKGPCGLFEWCVDVVELIIVVWWAWITWTEFVATPIAAFWLAELELFSRSTARGEQDACSSSGSRGQRSTYLAGRGVFLDDRWIRENLRYLLDHPLKRTKSLSLESCSSDEDQLLTQWQHRILGRFRSVHHIFDKAAELLVVQNRFYKDKSR